MVQVRRPDEGDVDAQITVMSGTVETEVDAKGDGRPCRVLAAAVEADFVGSATFELFEDAVRLGLGREFFRHLLFRRARRRRSRREVYSYSPSENMWWSKETLGVLGEEAIEVNGVP